MRKRVAAWAMPFAVSIAVGAAACSESDTRMAGDNPILDAREAKDFPDLPPERDNARPLRDDPLPTTDEPVPMQGPGAYGTTESPLPEAPPEIPADGVDVPARTVDSTDPTARPPGSPPPVLPEPQQR